MWGRFPRACSAAVVSGDDDDGGVAGVTVTGDGTYQPALLLSLVAAPFSVARCRSARAGDVPCAAADAAGGTGANLTVASLRNIDILTLYKKK
eukprot:gene6177-6485_t